jgi:hypothetical protein
MPMTAPWQFSRGQERGLQHLDPGLSSQQPGRRLPPLNRRTWHQEVICTSWNRGRCAFPESCHFLHICSVCERRGHRACECDREDSSRNRSPPRPPPP